MDTLPTVLRETWQTFKQHFWSLCVAKLSIVSPIILLNSLRADDVALPIWALLLLPLSQCVLVLHLASVVNKDGLKITQLINRSIQRWLPLLGLYLLCCLALISGFLLLILPMFIVMARLSFADFYCVLHKQGPVLAFKNSWRDTQALQWPILLGSLIFIALSFIPSSFLENIYGEMSDWGTYSIMFVMSLENVLDILVTVFCYHYLLLKQTLADSPSPILAA